MCMAYAPLPRSNGVPVFPSTRLNILASVAYRLDLPYDVLRAVSNYVQHTELEPVYPRPTLATCCALAGADYRRSRALLRAYRQISRYVPDRSPKQPPSAVVSAAFQAALFAALGR